MDKNNKTKIYILLGLCLIIILGLWLYSLKLNLTSLKNNDTNKSAGATNLINNIVDIFKAHPLTEPEEKVTTPIEELTNKIAGEIKNQNNSTSTADWLTYQNKNMGFEIKLPKDYEVRGVDSTTSWFISPVLKPAFELTSHFPYIEGDKIDKETKNINGVIWEKFKISGESQLMTCFETSLSDKQYHFASYLSETETIQILSTFKFLK